MKHFLLLLSLLTVLPCLKAQQTRHLTGFVNDADNGERLIGVNVYLSDRTRGTATDVKGYFNLSATFQAEICLSCLGYADTCLVIDQATDAPIVIRLRPSSNTLQAVDVKAARLERKPFNTNTLNAKQINQIPTLGCRPDIIKAAQQLPGIAPLTEGSSVMLVRGGSPGENLYMLDNVPLIYVNHLGGFMSVFNAEMINSMDIYKGGFPARFGGKLSSVVDLTTKKGDPSRLKGAVSAGLTDVAFAIEGPGGLKNSSFLVTGRKTLIEALMFAASQVVKMAKAQDFNIIYGFHDISAKYSWSPNAKNSLAFSIYEGDDYTQIWRNKKENDLVERSRAGNIWGNRLVSLQWNSAVSPKCFAANTLSFTQYRLKRINKAFTQNSFDTADFFIKTLSRVSDVSLRSDWKYFVNDALTLEYGLHSSYLNYLPSHISNNFSFTAPANFTHAFDNALYLDNKLKIGKLASGSVGLRLNAYNNGSFRHLALEPRLNFSLSLGQNQFNLTAMRVVQNTHLIMSVGSIMNNEVWIPADARIQPASSDQVSLGWRRGFDENRINLEVDAYYKTLNDLVTLREGFFPLVGDPGWHGKVTSGGSGKAYGMEMMARFDCGDFNGYAAYCYSRSTRRFEAVNNGNAYVYEYDRPHVVNLSGNYVLNDRWSFGALWTFESGLPFTSIIGVQYFPMISQMGGSSLTELYVYGNRNSERMKPYHRLDLAAKMKTHTEKGRKAEWTLSIYNAYCSRNAFYYYYGDPKGDPLYWQQYPDEPARLWQQTLFLFIPSFSYKVWF